MITRVHGRSSTLAANPKGGKRRKAKKGKSRKTSRRSSTLRTKSRKTSTAAPKRKRAKKRSGWRLLKGAAAVRGLRAKGKLRRPRKRGDRYTPALPPEMLKLERKKAARRTRALLKRVRVYAKGRGKNVKYSVRKNGGLVIAGVPVIEMAIGSVAAIALGHLGSALISKYAPAGTPAFLKDKNGIGGELLTAGAAAYLYTKVLKNPMHKEIAKFAFIGAVFQAISKQAGEIIGEQVAKLPGLSGHVTSTSGVYFDPYSQEPAVGGMYLPSAAGQEMGGIYTSVDNMSGLGLFEGPSIYG